MTRARVWKTVVVCRLAAVCCMAFVLLPVQRGSAGQGPNGGGLKVIRVVMDDNYHPFVFKDEQGKLRGIIIDQWRLWEEKNGIRAEN